MAALTRHRILYKLLLSPIGLFTKWKFNYSWDSLKDVEGPFLLLPNHNLELDPMVVGVAAGQHLYFVASEHLTRKGFVTKLLNYFLQPIYHQKGRAGAHTVKAILKTLRSGTSVCLFPEGNRSFNGLTCPISPATGKMAKRSGAKLITYKFEGHYLTQPRWATTLRRGRLTGKIVHIYTPEELQTMTDDEVNAAIVRDLSEDAYETQSREMVPFKGKKLALGMESTIFACPACGSIGTLRSNDTSLQCSCGYHADYDVYGYLTDGSGNRTTITELDRLQQELLDTRLVSAGTDPLFSDTVLLQTIDDNHTIVQEQQGQMIAYADHLSLCGEAVPFSDLLGMTIYSRNVLVIHTISEGRHFEVRSDTGFSALKYLYLYELSKKNLNRKTPEE